MARMGKIYAEGVLEGKKQRPRHGWENTVKLVLKDIG